MRYAVCDSATGRIVAVFDEPVTAALPDGHEAVEVDGLDDTVTHLSVAAMSLGVRLDVREPDVAVSANTLTIDAPETITCSEELLLTMGAVDDDGNPTALDAAYHLKMTWGLDILMDEDRSLVAGTDTVSFVVPDTRPLMGEVEQPYSIVVVATDPNGEHRGCSVNVVVPEPDGGSPVVIGRGGKLGGGLP